jgi:uncharacterized membrane protein required for colicin V production
LPIELTWLDAVIVLWVGFGFLAGYKRGVIGQLAGLVGVIAGFYIGALFWEDVSGFLELVTGGALGWPVRGIFAFLCCVFATSFGFSLLVRIVRNEVGKTISVLDQAGGGIIGIARSVLGIIIAFAVVGLFWPVIAFETVMNSMVSIYFAALSLDFISFVWPLLPEVARNLNFGF